MRTRVAYAIERDDPSTTPLRFCASNGQRALHQVYLAPVQRADLVLSERRIKRKGYDGAEQWVRLADGQQSRFLFFRHSLADVVRLPLELHITLKVGPELVSLQDLPEHL